MKKLWILVLIYSLNVYGDDGQHHYDGLSKNWANADTLGRLKIIDQYLPSAPVVYEVGTKDGNDAVKFAEMWPQGKIISFEANPYQFVNYQHRAKNYPNMFGYNLAVNTYNGFATFYRAYNNWDSALEGASSLLKPAEKYKKKYPGAEITVPCVVFDDWCLANDVKNIDFMWLDLEGFELQFLKSSPNIIKTVKVIYAETNFFVYREGVTQFDDLYNYLTSLGFEMIAHWYIEGVQGDAIFIRK